MNKSSLIFICLAIVGSVKCEVISSEENINYYEYNSVEPSTDTQYSHQSSNWLEEIMKNKCQINSHQDNAYQKLQKALADYYVCLNTRNATEILKQAYRVKQEINATYFKNLCKVVPISHYCSHSYILSLRECLNDKENDLLKIVQKVFRALESFTCQNDAEHVSEFFLDGGKDCIMNRSSAIRQCVNTLIDSFSTKAEYTSYDSFVSYFKFNKEQCNYGRKLQSCVVNELRQCDRPTTANLAESIFEIILDNTPCSNL